MRAAALLLLLASCLGAAWARLVDLNKTDPHVVQWPPRSIDTLMFPNPDEAYFLYAHGKQQYYLQAVLAISQIRRFDESRPVVFAYTQPLASDVSAALLTLRATLLYIPPQHSADMHKRYGTSNRCAHWHGCWMKFLAWSLPFKTVLYMDSDVLLVLPMDGAFEAMAKRSNPSPFDIAAAVDVQVAYGHGSIESAHAFNTGVMLVEPSIAVFEALQQHAASAGSWQGSAETFVINTFPRAGARYYLSEDGSSNVGGRWIQLAPGYNAFPHFVHAAHLHRPADDPAMLQSIYALHYVWINKLWVGMAEEMCVPTNPPTSITLCIPCCKHWLDAQARAATVTGLYEFQPRLFKAPAP